MKHKHWIFLFIISLIMGITSCKDSDVTHVIWVASEKRDCMGEGKQTCYLIKDSEEKDWRYFYDEIQGFEYTESFEYTLLVKIREVENPPMDASSLSYSLVRVLNKERKDSAYLPEEIIKKPTE